MTRVRFILLRLRVRVKSSEIVHSLPAGSWRSSARGRGSLGDNTYMMSATFSDFWTPSSPLSLKKKSANFVLFVCFLGTPIPLVRTSYKYGPLVREFLPGQSVHQYDAVTVLVQLAEHEVKVWLLRELLQRVRGLDYPKVANGQIRVMTRVTSWQTVGNSSVSLRLV